MDLFSTDLGIWPSVGISGGRGLNPQTTPLGTPLMRCGLFRIGFRLVTEDSILGSRDQEEGRSDHLSISS
jgi:hypothetical protein